MSSDPNSVAPGTSKDLLRLYVEARNAGERQDLSRAMTCYRQILLQEPNSWEATFYCAYYTAMLHTLQDSSDACAIVSVCLPLVVQDIRESAFSEKRKRECCHETATCVLTLVGMLLSARRHIDPHVLLQAAGCLYALGDELEAHFSDNDRIMDLAALMWKRAIGYHQSLCATYNLDENGEEIAKAHIAKLKQVEPSYTPVPEELPKEPEFPYDKEWTIQNFRNNSLVYALLKDLSK